MSPSDAGPAVVGRAPSATGGIPAMVTLEPVGAGPAGGERPVGEGSFPSPVMDQFGLAFLPPVLVVRAGSPVTFTNSEGALVHNVHIRSIEGDSTVFNGDTAPGEELSVELPSAGGYDVLCDMHPGMTAFLFVTDGPWATAAEADGRFRIAGVPPGTYVARVWTSDGGLGEPREVEVTSDITELDLTAPPG